MKTIVIRTLGGGSIGYGHFYRSLSLGKAIRLSNIDINIIYIINNNLVSLISNERFEYIVSDKLDIDYEIIKNINVDLFIFDSYLGDNDYLRGIKQLTKLMFIDDNNDIYDSTIPDIINNGNIHAENLNYKVIDNQLRLLGTEYLIMKEEYWDVEDNREVCKDGILITTGGSDQHKIAIKILKEIKDSKFKIRVIVGPGYKDDYIESIEEIRSGNIEVIHKPNSLKEYIRNSEIVITAGGSTVYEVLSQKSMPIIFSIAENQDLICQGMKNIGVDYIGKYPNIDYKKISNIIKKFKKESINYKFFIKVDGSGVKNIIKALKIEKL